MSPTSILQSKIRVCGAQRSNESPSGAFKRQNGLRQQMEGPRPDKFADVYTSALLAGAMKPLKVLFKFENHFAIRTVCFQVQLEADGYFSTQKFSSLQPQQAGQAGTTSQVLNLIFLQIQLQNTCWASPKPDIPHKIALAIVDGHTRYQILRKYPFIPFEVIEK